MAGGKTVQQPRGNAEQEDGIVGADGQLRLDMSRHEIRLHDNVTPGGHRIPNIETVRQLIAFGTEGAIGQTAFYATESELAAAQPTPNVLAIVRGAGQEEAYVWKTGTAPAGTLSSAVEGYWQRLDSDKGFVIRMWRAGMINLQINGSAPIANQAITAWLTGENIKLWDGDSYEVATPTLFARLFASIGDYYTGSISFPDRLAEVMVQQANLNSITTSGWYASTAAAANAPIAGIHPIHVVTDNTRGIMVLYRMDDGSGDRYVRVMTAGTWSADWVLDSTLGPERLRITGKTVTDLNLATEAGFYNFAATATNKPSTELGMIVVTAAAGNVRSQIVYTPSRIWHRLRDAASVWGTWLILYPANVTTAVGTLPLSRGGTGGNDAAAARANLDAAQTSHFHDAGHIITGILPLIRGGTAGNTKITAQYGIGLKEATPTHINSNPTDSAPDQDTEYYISVRNLWDAAEANAVSDWINFGSITVEPPVDSLNLRVSMQGNCQFLNIGSRLHAGQSMMIEVTHLTTGNSQLTTGNANIKFRDGVTQLPLSQIAGKTDLLYVYRTQAGIVFIDTVATGL